MEKLPLDSGWVQAGLAGIAGFCALGWQALRLARKFGEIEARVNNTHDSVQEVAGEVAALRGELSQVREALASQSVEKDGDIKAIKAMLGQALAPHNRESQLREG